MRHEFIGLAEDILRESKGRHIFFLQNQGNWGDALIRLGTIEFFNHFNIKYREISRSNRLSSNLSLLEAKSRNALLVCSGGGAWCDHYFHFSETIKTIQKKFSFRKVIVLPSTYNKEYSIKNTIFYRRDDLGSKDNMPNSKFCHDMAFFIESLESTPPVPGSFMRCFRKDVESSGKFEIREDNYDISGDGIESDPIHPFISHIARNEMIATDRLHVSITGCLLGRKVDLYPGSYFKNKAIYESSIRHFFPNTKFIE